MDVTRWVRGTGRRWLLPAGIVALLAVAAIGIASREQIALPDDRLDRSQLAAALIVILCAAAAGFVILLLMSKGDKGASRERKRESFFTSMLRMAIIFGLIYVIIINWDRLGQQPTKYEPAGSAPTGGPGQGPDLPFWSWPVAIVTLLFIAAITVFVVLAARRAPTPTGVQQQRNEAAEQIRAVLAEGRAMLAGSGDARDRVLRAYAAMENALANAGVAKRIADTPAELLARASVGDLFGPRASHAAERLAELFREARFSERPLADSAPDDAATALRSLEDDLGERVPQR
ncbi:DUF4129 domain-containing protein [Tenggerimyces flavus]|uniref:DUF4129 domain-containing protein n=1 Tax=Tenggerimyces flavus TaxID=1708749 RepID=A0ABV7YK37_9ACTN|nr:DUF4129 domain-containing protein [Tenggerimyces flavus]MBM7784911.1 NADH:ubiquinone oxidoreductase subunit 6 (subunit J) [Tenggerimyces flavus]